MAAGSPHGPARPADGSGAAAALLPPPHCPHPLAVFHTHASASIYFGKLEKHELSTRTYVFSRQYIQRRVSVYCPSR